MKNKDGHEKWRFAGDFGLSHQKKMAKISRENSVTISTNSKFLKFATFKKRILRRTERFAVEKLTFRGNLKRKSRSFEQNLKIFEFERRNSKYFKIQFQNSHFKHFAVQNQNSFIKHWNSCILTSKLFFS